MTNSLILSVSCYSITQLVPPLLAQSSTLLVGADGILPFMNSFNDVFMHSSLLSCLYFDRPWPFLSLSLRQAGSESGSQAGRQWIRQSQAVSQRTSVRNEASETTLKAISSIYFIHLSLHHGCPRICPIDSFIHSLSCFLFGESVSAILCVHFIVIWNYTDLHTGSLNKPNFHICPHSSLGNVLSVLNMNTFECMNELIQWRMKAVDGGLAGGN